MTEDYSVPSFVEEELSKHHFTVLSKLGEGAFGQIYLVESLKYKQKFAAKRIQLTQQPLPQIYQDILSSNGGEHPEITALMNLDFPNIIRIYQYFVEESSIYLILEYCSGGTMADLMRKSGIPSLMLLREICYQVARALKECHDHDIAHGDIKPGNIFFDQFERVKLADFGLARKHSDTFNGSGTFAFLSPEVMLHKDSNDFASDIWALGMTFYMFATGKFPWFYLTKQDILNAVTTDEVKFPSNLDEEFKDLVLGMLEKDHTQRLKIDGVLEHPFFANSLLLKSPNRFSFTMKKSARSQKLTSEIQQRKFQTAAFANLTRRNSYAFDKIRPAIPTFV